MRTIRHILCFCLVISLPAFADDRVGSVLRDIKVAETITAAVPCLKYESGDKNWSGGMFTNTLRGGTSFDSNTAYSILRSEPSPFPASAGGIASSIRDYLIKTYKLLTNENDSTWSKQNPDGLTPDDFCTVFIKSYDAGKEGPLGLEYITIQVSRIEGNRFAINLTYSTIR